MRRDLDERAVAGVAAGLSRRLGIDRTLIRGAFVVSTLTGGIGVAAYVLAWLFVPAAGEEASAAARAVTDRRGVALALGLAPALGVTLLVASVLGAGWLTTVAWPLFLAAGGLVLIWRNVGERERALLEESLGPIALGGAPGRRSPRRLVARVGLGLLLAVAGGLMLTRRGQPGGGVVGPLGGMLLVVSSVLVVFGPWWLQIARDLVAERQARARAEERADMAARLHDSVLQTLALIQRRAGDPPEVVALARAQERELRAWLFEGRVPGEVGGDTLAGAIEAIQQAVETGHGVPVEAVVVGDCALDDDLRCLVEAAREAAVNAARWSGAPEVSLFAEVAPEAVTLYVRDRGKGFDEADVAPDRRGVAGSIRARMARHGGRAEIRSRPGEGTEVILSMARQPGHAGAR